MGQLWVSKSILQSPKRKNRLTVQSWEGLWVRGLPCHFVKRVKRQKYTYLGERMAVAWTLTRRQDRYTDRDSLDSVASVENGKVVTVFTEWTREISLRLAGDKSFSPYPLPTEIQWLTYLGIMKMNKEMGFVSWLDLIVNSTQSGSPDGKEVS